MLIHVVLFCSLVLLLSLTLKKFFESQCHHPIRKYPKGPEFENIRLRCPPQSQRLREPMPPGQGTARFSSVFFTLFRYTFQVNEESAF